MGLPLSRISQSNSSVVAKLRLIFSQGTCSPSWWWRKGLFDALYLCFSGLLPEEKLGKRSIKNFMPMQPGEVPATYANVDNLINAVGFKPNTPIEEGITRFINWFKEYYKIK